MKHNTLRLLALVFSSLLAFTACSSTGSDYATGESMAPAPAADAGAAEAGDLAGWEHPAAAPEAIEKGEAYLVIDENQEVSTREESMLTFSLKVDTAAYTNVARYLESGSLPPADAVRTEELVNYFSFDEPVEFNGDSPFAIYTEVGPSPFDEDKALAFVRVKTQELEKQDLPASNLTFLIDTSGSMSSHDKLPLLKEAFGLLVDALDDDDTVSIVTYAGSSGVALDSASGGDKAEIMQVINGLRASGSTAGGNGILTAYELAEENFVEGGNNRIILASDGDFNVGISDLDELQELISAKRESGVYLSVLGFGTGNIRDDIMETLAAHGNGNYSYINSASTANKVLVEEMGSNFFTIADDVKAQVEFNPANVAGYRLIGYENRQMDNRDFANDAKDAGEIGVGTDVVALFELELAGSAADQKYAGDGAVYGDELFEVRIRYKNPGETESNLIEHPVTVDRITGDNTSDFRFASSVAALGEVLRGSEFAGELTISDITAMARGSLGEDPGGYRLDHLLLLRQCEELLG